MVREKSGKIECIGRKITHFSHFRCRELYEFLNKGLTGCKNAILPIVVPTECAVAGLYWGLVYKDVYNIYPDGHRYLPFWVDIQMHGLPFIFVLVEMFYYSPTFRVRRFIDFMGLAMFAVVYICWSSLCAHMDGEWPYPILQNTPCPWERLRLMLLSSAVGLAMHVVISETHARTITNA